ncbi:MAG TPA: lyase family protein [Spirochaetales bacterium]|nr:lyase family protein [Spirochaetales bacterium]
MQSRNIFENLSPLDHRYWLSNESLFTKLSYYLSEDGAVRYCARAELALICAHCAMRGIDIAPYKTQLDSLVDELDVDAVYREEEKTKHNIRALVNVLQKLIPESLAPLVHLGATSVDILDTAFSCRIRDAVQNVVLPLLAELVESISTLALREADTPQIGRTHGQHAVPITFGFALAEYVSRLGKTLERIDIASKNLRGKLAGATGSYNALSMLYKEPERIEALYLEQLGLLPSEHATQLVEPEYLLHVLLEINCAFGIIANLADDFRNLQRTEIDEIREGFAKTQVGSSTMPQKRNPWNSEHVKSLWKTFAPRVTTFFMDQISEHQRDLTNSASQRFIAEYIAGFCAACNRMLSVINSLAVNREKMFENIKVSGGAVLAEPSYILIADSGNPEAHELVRRITLEMEERHCSFEEALETHPDIKEILHKQLEKLGYEPRSFFANPANYNGRASQKAQIIARKYLDIAEKYKSKEVK